MDREWWQGWRWGAHVLVLGSLLVGCGGEPPPQSNADATRQDVVAPPAPRNRPTTVPTPATPAPGVAMVAQVDEISIPEAEVEARLARTQAVLASNEGLTPAEQAAALERAEAQIVAELVDEVLIRRAATERGLVVHEEAVDAALADEINRLGGQAAFDEWLTLNTLSLARYREAVRFQLLTTALREAITAEVPGRQEQREVRHILTSTQEEAEAVVAALQAGGDFGTLARTHSSDPGSRDQGGTLGFVPRGLLEPSLETVIWSLGPGETSGVVTSSLGYHLVQVVTVDPDRPLELPVLQALQARAFEQWLAEQRRQAQISLEPSP